MSAKPPEGLKPGRVLRAVARATRPELILGIALGIGLAIAGNLALTYGLGWYVLVALLACATILTVGAVLGFVVSGYYYQDARDAAGARGQTLGRTLTNVATGLLTVGQGTATEAEVDRLRDDIDALQPVARDLAKAGGGVLMRVLAFGRLAAVLGAAVSFAIFLATFMQVEKLELQNQLIETSNHLSEAARRTLLVGEIQDLNADLAPYASGSSETQFLAPELVDRIVNLSVGLRPYRFLQYDEPDIYKAVGQVAEDRGVGAISERALSAERGRLLLRLLSLPIENLRDLAEARPDFSRADLRGTRIDGFDFNHLVLSYADFRNAEGMGVTFRSAQLQYADFSGAELLGADFSDAEEQVSSVRYSGTDLRFAKFAEARLNSASFVGADLQGADLSFAVLFDADFAGASLAEADLSGAAIWSADDDEAWSEAQSAFDLLLTALPAEERSRWTLERRDPGRDHKYLGGEGDRSLYAFISPA